METRWPIHWIQARQNPRPGKTRGKMVTLGICGKTRAVMRAGASVLTMLIMTDFYVDEEKQSCEEGLRCFNTACPLNRTTVKTYLPVIGLKRQPKWFTEVKPVEVDAELQALIDRICEAHPDRGVVSVSTR